MKQSSEPYTVKKVTKENVGGMLNNLFELWRKSDNEKIEREKAYTSLHEIPETYINSTIQEWGGIANVPFNVSVKVKVGGVCVDMPFSTLIIYKDKLKQINK